MQANKKRPLACTTCAKAKARCFPGPSGQNDCERCHRLGKTCLSRTPAPPRPKKHIKRSRVAELEKRLSELEGNGGGGGGAARQDRTPYSPGPCEYRQGSTAPTLVEGASAPAKSPQSGSDRNASLKVDIWFDHLFPPKESSSAWPKNEQVASSPHPNAWETLWPDGFEAEFMLATYMKSVAPLFPFVLVPDMKASKLKVQRPFVWRAVMMATSFLDGARHERLGEDLLAEISRATMVDGVKSLDILQGLQLLVAWFHCALGKSRLANLLFLARSLCVGLGLGSNQLAPEAASAQNLDPLRAYAGTYYLNTLVFTTNKRTEVLMNTAYLERCCNILDAAKQYESDEFLVALVRVQLLAQSISLTLAVEPGQQPMQLPMTMVVQSFQDQINMLKTSLSPKIAGTHMIRHHIAVAEVLLTEWALSDRNSTMSNMSLTDRLGLLWSCVRSLRIIFEIRSDIWDKLDNPMFLCLHASDVSYALITGIRLVTLRLPGWNLEQIENELKFHEVMDKIVEHLEGLTERRKGGGLSRALRVVSPNDPFPGLANLCVAMRERITIEMAKALEATRDGVDSADPTVDSSQVFSFGVNDMGDEYWREFMNDAFWNGPVDFEDLGVQ